MTLRIVGYLLYLAALAAIAAIIFLVGCGGTPDLPPCGPGTYEFRGICLSTETEPPCGPGTNQLGGVCVADNVNKCGAGTHWDPEVCEGYGACGKCIADPVPPAKTLVCGEGTKEANGKCVALSIVEQDKDCLSKSGSQMPCFNDGDKDGYGGKFAAVHCSGLCEAFGLVDRDGDCDDKNANSHPNASEVCGDGLDNNCDGKVDEADPNAGTICIKNPLLSKESVPHWGQLTCQDVGDNKTKKLICAGESICFKTETCGNGVDDDCDGQVDEGCLGTGVSCKNDSECKTNLHCSSPASGICAVPCKTDNDCPDGTACFNTWSGQNGELRFSCLPAQSSILVSASGDTPTSQMLVMGSTGVELLRFRLNFDAQEEITLDSVTIKDEMSSLQNGSLQNFKLMNGLVKYAEVSALSIQNSTATFGEFGGMGVKWPKGNYAVTLAIKADIVTSFNGSMSSVHRLRVIGAVATTKSGFKVAVQIAPNDQPIGNWLSLVRAKLTIAWAIDTPSGLQIPSAEQVVAKFVATNSSNVGNYSLWINGMKLAFCTGSSGMRLGAQNTIRIYKDSLAPANLLATHKLNADAANFSCNIPYIQLSSLEIASGMNRNIIVTLDTANASFVGSDNRLAVILPPNDSILWNDGMQSYGFVDSPPLASYYLIF